MKLLKAPALPHNLLHIFPFLNSQRFLLHMEQRWCRWHTPSPPHCLIRRGRRKTPGIQSDDSKEGRETLMPKEQKKEPQMLTWPCPPQTESQRTSGTEKTSPSELQRNKERNVISSVAVSPLLRSGILDSLKWNILLEGGNWALRVQEESRRRHISARARAESSAGRSFCRY